MYARSKAKPRPPKFDVKIDLKKSFLDNKTSQFADVSIALAYLLVPLMFASLILTWFCFAVKNIVVPTRASLLAQKAKHCVITQWRRFESYMAS